MFTLSQEQLRHLGAAITTSEIKQQPELWTETFSLYAEKREKIEAFLQSITKKHDRVRVIFTGAGTSAYVGDTVTPYIKGKVDENKWDVQSVPTTAIVSNPYQFLKAEIPTLLISFARSGNSPESVATVELAEQIVTNLYQITITCSKDGKLAQRAAGVDENLLLLMPEKSNDQGFAMTGSYTCMTLTALLIFDSLSVKEKMSIVSAIRRMGESVVNREYDIQNMVGADFDRIIYLGSGGFEGLAREAQLKILELTAGKIATSFDSSLGFRHGPKSFVNEKAALFVFVSSQPYTRQYDIDMLNELKHDQIAQSVYAIAVDGDIQYDGDSFRFEGGSSIIPDAYLSLPFVMVAQTIGLVAAIKVGNTPDTPSPTGTVNRVVKGVIIHEYK